MSSLPRTCCAGIGYAVPCYAMPCFVAVPCYAVPDCGVLCCSTLCCAVSFCALRSLAVPCCSTLCCGVSPVLCCAVLCRACRAALCCFTLCYGAPATLLQLCVQSCLATLIQSVYKHCFTPLAASLTLLDDCWHANVLACRLCLSVLMHTHLWFEANKVFTWYSNVSHNRLPRLLQPWTEASCLLACIL